MLWSIIQHKLRYFTQDMSQSRQRCITQYSDAIEVMVEEVAIMISTCINVMRQVNAIKQKMELVQQT